jgi:predicted GNAT family acetyltransferase
MEQEEAGMNSDFTARDKGDEVQVRHNQPVRSYEAVLDGAVVGTLIYETAGGRRSLTHTFVDPQYRGRGIAAELARYALNDAKAEGIRPRAVCGYVAGFVERNPEYQQAIDST